MLVDKIYVITSEMPVTSLHGLNSLLDIAGIPFPVDIRATVSDIPLESLIIVYGNTELAKSLLDGGYKCLFINKSIDHSNPFILVGYDHGIIIPSSTKGAIYVESALSIEFDILEATFLLLSGFNEFKAEEMELSLNPFTQHSNAMYLDRPLVNEYAAFFENKIRILFKEGGVPFIKKGSQPPGRTMTLLLALDFDTYYKDTLERAKQLAGTMRILKNINNNQKPSVTSLMKKTWSYLHVICKKGKYDRMPLVRSWLEEHNLRATFNIYFKYNSNLKVGLLSRIKQYVYDPDYDISKLMEYILLLRKMSEEGHDIGLQYGAFSCSRGMDEILTQKNEFQKILGFAPISGRHHFLGQRVSVFYELLERASIQIDASPAFLDKSGFRYYTVSPFQGFNFINKQHSSVLNVSTPLWDGVINDGRFDKWEDKMKEIEGIIKIVCKYSGTIASGIHPRAYGSDDYYRDHWKSFGWAYNYALSLGAKTDTCSGFLSWWRMRKNISASIIKKNESCELAITGKSLDPMVFEISYNNKTVYVKCDAEDAYAEYRNNECYTDYVSRLEKNKNEMLICVQ